MSLAASKPPPGAIERTASTEYVQRDPQQSVLYRIIDQHLPSFLEHAREHADVPGFVRDAFQDFLSCGVLAHGLCRFRCSDCRCERLVALSCKARGKLDTDPIADSEPVLAACYQGSVASLQTLGSRPGSRVARVGNDRHRGWVERALGPLQAHIEGFDLHARLAIATDQAGGKTRLEKLARYCARPPIANDRLSLTDNGRVLLRLKTPWADGTTHLAYEPLDFLAKLAALIPRPHKNLALYHGVLAARSKLRSRVVSYGRGRADAPPAQGDEAGARGRQRGAWADLMRRAFGYELLACPHCGGKLVFLSCILRRDVIAKILARAGPRG